MRIVLGMTRHAFFWCALENTIHVAGFALHVGMRAGKRESGLVVIESDILPAARVMT